MGCCKIFEEKFNIEKRVENDLHLLRAFIGWTFWLDLRGIPITYSGYRQFGLIC